MMLREGGGALSAGRILSQMQSISRQIGNGSQEDAHEFLRFVIYGVLFLSVWLFNFIFTISTLLYPGSWLRQCSLYVWRAWVERIWLIPDCKKQPLYSILLGVVLSRRCSLLLCTLLVKFGCEVYLLGVCQYFLPTMIFTMSTSLQAGQMFEMSS